ncbi:unnamed protein product [Rotaria sp. Silwood1]|nr:unnamed protein product [Rotaria sp. Silwood1]
MLSTQTSTPVLPRVTKLYHHRRRRQHRSFRKPPRRHSSKTKSQLSITTYAKIHRSSKVYPKNDDKIFSAVSTDHPLNETTPIESQKQREESNTTTRSISPKVRQCHCSATEATFF